ncbi:MAG: radical SAM protein [Nitrospirae bacterium]|nr:radical SAM protein [Nitrospirota bacterium]
MTYSTLRHLGSVIYKRKPIQLTFFLTRKCNSQCPFCFYLSSSPVQGSAELSLGEIEKISRSMGKLLWLAFSGGEIFLRDDLADITRLFYDRNKPSIILFPTNGLLTNVIYEKIETILRYCRKSTIAVKLSIDGTESVHDSLRGKGSFRRTLQTHSRLGTLLGRYGNFELGINTVFCSANQDNMADIIEFVSKMDNINTHTVSLIRGDVPDSTLKDIDITKYHGTIKLLEANLKNGKSGFYRFKGARLKAAQDILQRNLIHETAIQKKQVIPCFAGKLNMVLTESGDVYPCESFSEKLGNVRDSGYNVAKLLNSGNAKKVIRSINKKRCFCTHECYYITNILFNPKRYPMLIKEYLQL